MFVVFDSVSWQTFFLQFPAIWLGCAAFTGAILASFFGVLVDRLPKQVGWDRESPDPDVNLITPSRCDHCGKKLNFIALVPVLGWLWYRGKCFNCATTVPWIYPAVEALVAALSVCIAFWFGPTEMGVWALFALWGSVLLSWMDFREHWLPDRVTLPLLAAGFLASPFQPDVLARNEGAFLYSGVLWLIFVWKGWTNGVDTMSGGDLVLCAVVGSWLGFSYVPALLAFTALIFALYTIPMRLRGEKWAPLGPAICGSWLLCLILGHHVSLI